VELQNGDRIEIVGKTDIGRKRVLNEDNIFFSKEIGLAVIADGMGGHEAGEVASKLAVDEIFTSITRHAETSFDDDSTSTTSARHQAMVTTSVMRDSVCSAGAKIHALNQELGHIEGQGMGTTAVAVFVDVTSNNLTFANVGDSRLYRFRHKELEQLTVDHTAIQRWLDTGREGPAPKKNVLLRALGPRQTTEVDTGIKCLLSGDILMLCSDGLHGFVSSDSILQVLASMESLEAGCNSLVDLANYRGGKDNISVILIRYD